MVYNEAYMEFSKQLHVNEKWEKTRRIEHQKFMEFLEDVPTW